MTMNRMHIRLRVHLDSQEIEEAYERGVDPRKIVGLQVNHGRPTRERAHMGRPGKYNLVPLYVGFW